MSLGADYTLILKSDGTVWAAGDNTLGQLAMDSGTVAMMTNFVEILSGGAKDVTAGGGHSMVVKQDGSLWCTGGNMFGQLGDSTIVAKSTFTLVVTQGAKAVAAGHSYSMILQEDGSVWATGSNVHGQLGDGSTADSNKFIKVISSGAKAIAAGLRHSMVLIQDSSVWATGWNLYGQFGDGSITSTSVFTRVFKLSNRMVPDSVTPSEKRSISDTRAFTRASSIGKKRTTIVSCERCVHFADFLCWCYFIIRGGVVG